MARKANVAGVPGVDPTLPKVPLTIKGHTYHLCFDFNAIAVAEEKTGLDLLGNLDLQRLNVRSYRALLFAALLKESPEITVEEVGSLVTMASLPEITVALVHAWTGSRPEIVQAEADKNQNPPVEQIEKN